MTLTQAQEILAGTFTVPFESASQLKDWIYNFLDLDLPIGWIDPDSNSSPVDWLFEAYTTIKDNLGSDKPSFVVYAPREGYKTLACAALEVIAMVHFNLTVAHMAAIESQSKKSVQYINTFLKKLKPYLEFHGRSIVAQNAKNLSIVNTSGDVAYLTIIICTMAGANCISPESVVHFWDDTTKLAKDVLPGDVLKTWDYTELKDVPVVVGSVSNTAKQSREIVFDDGSNIVVSDDHQVFTNKGWITASNVKIGDRFTEAEEAIISTGYTYSERNTSTDLKQLILGTLLGDASLYKTTNKVRYQVSHCKKQLPYLEFINKSLNEHGIHSSIIPDENEQFKLVTKTNEIFNEFLHLYNPTKKITKEILQALNFEGIAYWFMDDARGNGRGVGKRKDHCFELATCCFSLEENDIIVDYFKSLGFDCCVKFVTNSSNKKYPIVKFTLESSRRLTEKISPYFVTSMRYKLLTPIEHQFSRSIVTGNKLPYNGQGFVSEESPHSTRHGREWISSINQKLNAVVVKVNLIGEQELVDLHIDTKNEHHKSFYVNSMKLVHNSEHTNMMVVDEIDVVRFPQAYEICS